MLLNVKKRLLLLGILPKKGNLADQLIVKDIGKKIEISSEEAKSIDLKSNQDSVVWDAQKATDIEIELSSAEINLLKSTITDLDNTKSITPEILDLCVEIKDLPNG